MPQVPAGQQVLATITLSIAPRPGTYRVRFWTGTSMTGSGDWVTLRSEPLTITVPAP